jgi:hypothetical protein
MKKLIVAVMIVAFAVTAAWAADVVTYESKKGNVTFDHKAHADKLGCKACHEGAPAKIAVDKKGAHKAVCKDCHKKQGGPTKCNACHVK